MLIKVFIKYDDSQEVMLAMKNNYESLFPVMVNTPFFQSWVTLQILYLFCWCTAVAAGFPHIFILPADAVAVLELPPLTQVSGKEKNTPLLWPLRSSSLLIPLWHPTKPCPNHTRGKSIQTLSFHMAELSQEILRNRARAGDALTFHVFNLLFPAPDQQPGAERNCLFPRRTSYTTRQITLTK